MKKLFTFVVTVFCVFAFSTIANAQYSNGEIHYKAMGNLINADGTKLSVQELEKMLSPELFTQYEQAKSKYKGGVILTGIGTGLFVTGLGGMYIASAIGGNAEDMDDPAFRVGFALYWYCGVSMVAGLVLPAIGIPKWIKGKNALKRVANGYNQSFDNLSLSVGATNNGLGLTLNF